MSTQYDIENLIYTLNLSPYQARELYLHRNEYDMGRLQMCGSVLFAPRKNNFFARILNGASGDIIGHDRTFLRRACRVKMRPGGYHSGRVGASTYYGNPMGCAIMRDEFDNCSDCE